MKKFILVLMFVMLIPVLSWGSDVEPTQIQNMYMWDLSGVKTATGDTNVMVGSLCKGTCTAIITASGTVSMTAAFKVQDESGGNTVTVKTYTLSSAASTGYMWSFPAPRMYITFTITTGQVDKVKVYCKEN